MILGFTVHIVDSRFLISAFTKKSGSIDIYNSIIEQSSPTENQQTILTFVNIINVKNFTATEIDIRGDCGKDTVISMQESNFTMQNSTINATSKTTSFTLFTAYYTIDPVSYPPPNIYMEILLMEMP